MSKKIAIEVNTNPTKWVSGIFSRIGSSVRVELTDDKDMAHDFLTMDKAKETIPNIHNPYDRVFKAVSLDSRKRAGLTNYNADLN